jgi:hypothetical protein
VVVKSDIVGGSKSQGRNKFRIQFFPLLCNPRWRQYKRYENKNCDNCLTRTYELELHSLSILCQLSVRLREMLKCMSLWTLIVTECVMCVVVQIVWFRVLLQTPSFVQSHLGLDKIPKNSTLCAVLVTCVITLFVNSHCVLRLAVLRTRDSQNS